MGEKDRPGRPQVLFVSDHFGHANGVIHGATRYFLTTLPRLIHRDIRASAAFLRGDHPASAQLANHAIELTFFGRAKWSPLPILDAYRLIRKKKINIIHASGMKGILVARIASKLTGVPVVSHLHDGSPISNTLRGLMRSTDRWSAHTLAVTKDVGAFACDVLGSSPDKTEVLANGLGMVEIDLSTEADGLAFRDSHGIARDAPLIGIIARLDPVKGHDTMLRAMPGVLAQVPGAVLMIAGDGPERTNLDKRIHEMGLRDHVVFTGHIRNPYAAIRAINLAVLPSLRDGLPYSLLEAMAMGRPVVASAVGGLAQTIQDRRNGLLVPPRNAQALAHAVNAVLKDPGLAATITQGGLATARSFDINRHVDRLVEIYDALAQGQPVPSPKPLALPEPANESTSVSTTTVNP